jgi:hypothetical protein
MAVFKYKIPRKARSDAPAFNAQLQKADEGLTGMVQGSPASDLEERFARALAKDNRVMGYTFREPVISARNLPGQLEVDFVIQSGPLIIPVQIDGEFAHKGQSKKQEDALKDAMVNDYYRQYGASLVKRIDGDLLSDQNAANKLVRELL